MRFRHDLLLSTAALLALGACTDADGPTEAATPSLAESAAAPTGDRLATVEWEGSSPRLYLQNLDGSERKQVHFVHVSDHVTGNYSPRQLPVTDESIRAIPRMKWSPDGRYLAVVVAPSTEALQIVLVSADGRALRTVSPNSQYLWGDLDWSPDGSRLAYILSTGPFGRAPDLFVTELGADRVTRVTVGSRLSGYDVVRFAPSGQQIFITERLGFADDGVNGLARLSTVDLATGTITPGDAVIGEPQGLPRDGSWSLFIRWSASVPGARELFRRAADGTEAVLATGGLRQAVVLEDDSEAILVSTAAKAGGDRFDLIGLALPDDVHATLPVDPAATWAAAWLR
jgi:dipeptidyl aminopeptidase/acylaminoacyl peptidase